jgi:hypothetical protein
MTFVPHIDVLTQQPEVLQAPDLSFDAILAHFPGLAEASAACLTGSTAAGWSNTFSDVDLYCFADVELNLPVDETMEASDGSDRSGIQWSNWMGRYADARVDLKVWPTNTVATVLKPYLAENEPEFGGAGTVIEDFIYRVSIARPLKNPQYFDEAKALLKRSSYGRSLARSLKALAENSLTDVVGQLDSNDALSARITAVQASRHAADACLVIAGDLCRREKWLLRRIESTPACGISVDEYRTVVLGGPLPGETDTQCALRVGRWAQSHLVRMEARILANG